MLVPAPGGCQGRGEKESNTGSRSRQGAVLSGERVTRCLHHAITTCQPDRRTDGGTGGGTDRDTGGQTEIQVDRQRHKQTDRDTGGQMDRQRTGGGTDRCTDRDIG